MLAGVLKEEANDIVIRGINSGLTFSGFCKLIKSKAARDIGGGSVDASKAALFDRPDDLKKFFIKSGKTRN